MTQEQLEKRWKFADALEAAVKASDGIKSEGWDVPIGYLVEEIKRGIRCYGYGRVQK